MPRVLEPELLDEATGPAVQSNLSDIEHINRWFGGERALHAELGRLPAIDSILDVAAGNGWASRSLHRRFGARVVSLDRSANNLAQAPYPKVVADARALPFADDSFDVVISNLFLHHLSNEEAHAWLISCARIARRAVICVDLERNRFAECFLSLSRPLFRWHPITLADGPTSVRAAFTCTELRTLAARTGIANGLVRRAWPWQRLVLSFVK
ncbi:MAG: methyltransferase domain-containing protein [Acidobacteriota bacterium]